MRTTFNFAPLDLDFSIEHPNLDDARHIFAQFGEISDRSTEGPADCSIYFDDTVPVAPTSTVYPLTDVNSDIDEHEQAFESRFDCARVRWNVRGTTEIFLNPLSYERNPHYVQNLLLKALRHASLVKGFLVVHASGCTFNQVAAILIGRQNSGKSSFSLITGANGGYVISDDMLIVGESTDHRLSCRAARGELVLREKMAKEVFGEHLDQFTRSDFYPSNEVKYVLQRCNPVVSTQLSAAINKILIASNPKLISNEKNIQRITNRESLSLLTSEICGQYDATIYKFTTHMKMMMDMLNRLCRVPGYQYTKSKKFEENPVEATLQNWEFLYKDE